MIESIVILLLIPLVVIPDKVSIPPFYFIFHTDSNNADLYMRLGMERISY
jgi:hypothetical protein